MRRKLVYSSSVQLGMVAPSRLPADLTVVIPTRNSARYLHIVLQFYRQHYIPVTVLVDSRTTDGTFAIAEQLCNKVVTINTRGALVLEDFLGAICEHCETRWVLRIDDDELPSWGKKQFNLERRSLGREWPSMAHTMIGRHLHNLRELTERVLQENIPGGLIETGVWRGGAGMVMRAVLSAYAHITGAHSSRTRFRD